MGQRENMKEKGFIEVYGVFVRPEHKPIIRLISTLSREGLLTDQTTQLIINLLKK